MKIGIIGCGKQAPKHISGYRAAGCKQFVVTDIFTEAGQALAERERATFVASPEELLNDPKVDAISICTPTPSHAPLIRQAIAQGKHFIVEKPLTDDLAEARALAHEVEAAGVTAMVGFIYRFVPSFVAIKEAVAGADANGTSPALGQVRHAFLRAGGRGSAAAWKHNFKTGGGVVNEMVVHMLDLAHWFFGPAESTDLVLADIKWPKRQIEGESVQCSAEDFAVVSMKMKSGVDVLIQCDLTTPAFTQYLEVQGNNGTLFGSIQQNPAPYMQLMKDTGDYSAGKTELEIGGGNLYGAQIGMFVDAVREGRQPERNTIKDALTTMESHAAIRGQLGKFMKL